MVSFSYKVGNDWDLGGLWSGVVSVCLRRFI